jgi:hypothetical protein
MKARVWIWMVTAAFVAGCATSGTPRSSGPTDAAIGSAQIGVVTVADLYRRSDVAILAPAQEHVVWKRTELVVSGRAVMLDRTAPTVRQASVAIDSPVAPVADTRPRWPLLAEDGNPQSQIGVLAMCKARNVGCNRVECYRELEPCETPERYDCVEGKALDYCVEKPGAPTRLAATAGTRPSEAVSPTTGGDTPTRKE